MKQARTASKDVEIKGRQKTYNIALVKLIGDSCSEMYPCYISEKNIKYVELTLLCLLKFDSVRQPFCHHES